MKNNSLFISYIYALLSGTIYGFLVFGGGVMGRNGFSLIEILILPNAIVSLILFGFVKKNLKSFFNLPLWIGTVYPLMCVLCQIGQYAPLFMGVSVSLTLFLLYTQPVWTILLSTVIYKNKFTKDEALTADHNFLHQFIYINPFYIVHPFNIKNISHRRNLRFLS